LNNENIILDKPFSYLSLLAWKHRLVFWIGAIVVGLVIVMLTWLSEWTTQTYHALSLHYPWFQFIIPPVGMGLTAWLTFRFFPDSERSGIPQIKAALELSTTLADRALKQLGIDCNYLFRCHGLCADQPLHLFQG
jgi:H+/Cl- antiporter ClcA